MSERINQGHFVDSLPSPARRRTIDMMISGDSSRKISAWLLEQGHKISFAAIARYKREELPRHLDIVAKLKKMEQLNGNDTLEKLSIAEITNQILAADPILSRLEKHHTRIDRCTDQAESNQDFTSVSALLRTDIAALRLNAELSGRLQQAAPQVAVQVVVNGNIQAPVMPSMDNGAVIDIDPIRETK